MEQVEAPMSAAQPELALGGDGDDGPPPPLASRTQVDLFLALQLSEMASRQATDIAGDFMVRLGVAEAIRPLHMTLWPLGKRSGFSTLDLAAKKEQLSSVFFEPFMLKFDEIMSFQRREGKWALVLCCSRSNAFLFQLYRQIIDAQRQPGVEGGTVPAFNPHVTLFYSHQKVPRQPLKTPVRWLVRDFHMIWSHTGEREHESLWHWPPSA
jgi:2'-5' RNA ligase